MTDKYPKDDPKKKIEQTQDLSRRNFLKNSGLVVGGLVVGGSIVGGLLTNNSETKKVNTNEKGAVKTSNPQEALQFFTRHQDFLVLSAATEQIFPKDENGPGAIELGVPYYIDKQLAGRWGINGRDYRHSPFVGKTVANERSSETHGEQSILDRGSIFLHGLRKLDEESQKRFKTSFDTAKEAQQIEILQDFEDGKVKLNGLLSQEFFGLLFQSTIEGAYSDPLYGGNRNMEGWKMKEFPGAQASYMGVIEKEEFQKIEPVSLTDYQGH
ncbi:gluconate 2-dehydrogenase subunit 3 family protein [Psychrobacillus sp. L4]|uniref:gluconate 2-dehydrogenase subunit 3 family protein n=1 Tax=Psychrobacillus sp. L4 TaxID=3236892 RepID=UPI0036F23E37